jgi:hypothetical protein
MKNLNRISIYGTILLLISCSDNNERLLDFDQSIQSIESKASAIVSEHEIIEFADQIVDVFLSNTLNTENESIKKVKVSNVLQPITVSGRPYMWYLNYPDNKGYILFSANKTDSPILAFSDEGTFDPFQLSEMDKVLLEEKKVNLLGIIR